FAGTFDEYGFLLNPDLWTEALAEKVAHLQGIDELSEKHWRVVKHIRTKYLEVGGLPTLRLVCRAVSLSKEEIYALFGGCLPAWRIAGLPDPGEEARAYMS
ncbi:MAG: TusE/DsrC/DsvC family sulfur relay protein, partial [Gammaproteobacteria bacterium]|nr:TusE/DsrC/DsvC family sulfur relay protein [Gammaproteobacteria bacterium]